MVEKRIIDDVVDERRLPGWENPSVNGWIGIFLQNHGTDDYARDTLRELLSNDGYTGNSPVILFGIYDFLAPDSEEALVHGVRAYELSDHDLELVARLKNPGRLVSYIIDVTDEIEPLATLQEKMFHASKIRSPYSGFSLMGTPQYRSTEKSNAAPSIVELGLEINERLAHISPSVEQIESLGLEKWGQLYSRRRQALERAILAQQHLTGASKETLSILAIYDRLTGTADVKGLDYEVLDAFMRIKLELDKPSQNGEIPDVLKADAYWQDRIAFGIFDREQEWRMRHFGRRQKDWERNREQSQKQKEDGEKLENDYQRMLEDPWAFYAEQLALLGLAKEMSLAEAKRIFHIKAHEYSSAFTTLFNTSSEYAASQEAAKAFLSAWESVSPLYKAKETAEATI